MALKINTKRRTEKIYVNEIECKFKKVKSFNNNIYFLLNSYSDEVEFVIKIIENKSNSAITNENDKFISRWLKNNIPALNIRSNLLENHCSDGRGEILYKFLGHDLNNPVDRENFDSFSEDIYKLVSKIHLNSVSDSFGNSPINNKKYKNVFESDFNFFIKDLSRESQLQYIYTILFNKWSKKIIRQSKYTLIHKDIHLANILKSNQKRSGKFTLIDWSYSTWGNPAYDIANLLFMEIVFSKKSDKLFENVYKIDKLYKKNALMVTELLNPYIARKLIDCGRFYSNKLIDIGVEILKAENFEITKGILIKNRTIIVEAYLKGKK